MSATEFFKPANTFQFCDDGEMLFIIHADGAIERGPGFTTIDEMSLKFWEAVERQRRPLCDLPTDTPAAKPQSN